MKLFLYTSVLLAACGSADGASREIVRRAPLNDWELITTPYVIGEVLRNLNRLPPLATVQWSSIESQLLIRSDVFTLDRPVVFGPVKDRPILFAAIAWAEVLLTMDQRDFGELMAHPFYGLVVLRPGTFLEQERSQSRLR